jgi:hypothetical protein
MSSNYSQPLPQFSSIKLKLKLNVEQSSSSHTADDDLSDFVL